MLLSNVNLVFLQLKLGNILRGRTEKPWLGWPWGHLDLLMSGYVIRGCCVWQCRAEANNKQLSKPGVPT